MCQNSKTNCCQDYSLLTANTGISEIRNPNPNLNGSGTLYTILTAGANGTIVKSVTLKATEPSTTGMVRLYIQNPGSTVTALYKEIPIPVMPELMATPTPTPVLPMFETTLLGDLKLEAGYKLVASTQNTLHINAFAEGLDWAYPEDLPTDCCNFKQVGAISGVGMVSAANANLDGSGTIVSVFTSGQSTNGTVVKSITIKALQSTSINGMIRIFLSSDSGTTFLLMREIPVSQTTQSAYEPSYKQVLDLNYNLQADHIIGVSTQNAEAFAITIEGEEWSYPIS